MLERLPAIAASNQARDTASTFSSQLFPGTTQTLLHSAAGNPTAVSVCVTYGMDNMDWERAQLLLFTIAQCEGAVNYNDEDGNTRNQGGNDQHVHLDSKRKGEKEGEQELEPSSDKLC